MTQFTRRNLLKLMGATAPALLLPKAILRAQKSAARGMDLDTIEDLKAFAFDEKNPRKKFNFNLDWKVATGAQQGAEEPAFNDRDWKLVSLPYAWNEDDAFKKDIHDLSVGIAWYRKSFKLPESARGMKIIMECEGIRHAGTFYLNGKKVGLSENGIMAFGFDLTPYIHFGATENILVARIDNSWDYREVATNSKYQWNDRNFYANYGGINKNVYLHVLPTLYQTLPLLENLGTTGVYVYATDYAVAKKQAILHIQSEVKNESSAPKKVQLEVTVKDMEGKLCGRFSGETKEIASGKSAVLKAENLMKDLHFWSWGYGYLYEVETSLLVNDKKIDAVNTITGFRKTAFEKGMVYLNDRVIQMHGYAQRTTNEWPGIGNSVPAWLSDYSNGLMVQGNANLVRWMHVTPWKQDVESCDRVGLIQAMPAGDSEGDVTGTRWDQRKAVMSQAIVYNRNNPSILFYECGNHGISRAHMLEMKAIRDQYDPNGGRAIGSREMLDIPEAEYGGEMLYINKSSTKPLWAMEYSRDEGLRKYWDDYTPPFHKDGDGPLYKNEPAQTYNRNMDTHAIENVVRWHEYWDARPGTGDRVSSGGVNIVFSDSNTHHRGESNYRTSGEVDAMRIKKQNYYANQVMWNGWVDIPSTGIHIIGHWNYTDKVTKDIYVVSTADKVILLLNGKQIGGKNLSGERSDEFLFKFAGVHWQPGELTAKGFDSKGKVACTHTLTTTGTPFALKLKVMQAPGGLQADGHDLAMVEVEVVDKEGRRCPTALNMINFDVQGPATWKGGIAVGPGNYIGATSLPVEGGVNRVFIRAGRSAGRITVQAKSEGLKEATLTVKSQAVEALDGLALKLPAAALNGKLTRGPGPDGPTYTVKRNAQKIIAVSAGANTESAKNSYDDNERTAWENDGLLSTAWIEYTLERPASIDEVVLKLNGFRTKIYPLRITVDGKTVFEGKTGHNLGYFTAVCKSVKGSKVRIQLAANLQNSGDFMGKEMGGKKLGDGVASKSGNENAKGRLSIIEAEIYEMVK